MANQTPMVMEEDKRLEAITEQIVRYANADFSDPGDLSEKGDAIDSIVMGLNVLGEELQSYIERIRDREAALNQTLYQLNEAQHLAHIGSWEWDIPGNHIIWSDELYRLYGVSSEAFEATYENFLKFIHPEDRNNVNDIVQGAYQTLKPFNFFHRLIRPDGMVRILHSRGEVLADSSGQPLKMTGTAQDVTDIRNAEQHISRLASIVESSSDAIISKSLDGKITSWNKQAQEMFGYSEGEVIGKHISMLFTSENSNEEALILSTTRKGTSLNNFETFRKHKNGTLIPIAATISPIYDGDEILGISTIARDISEKKQAEEQLRQYTRQLEYKNKETEQFSYIASHDLQEPLRTITNYIGLLGEEYQGKLDATADLYLNMISGAANRMKALITDLLEYTRLENDTNQLMIDINQLLEDIQKNMEVTIKESHAQIIVGPMPIIPGYATRLNSLFQNLISNGIKFHRPGVAPVINIQHKENTDSYDFTIEDNGIGIEPEYHEKIFMLFQRLHSRTEYQGTGIGLANCKKIVELRGGKIWVESTPGSGSTFHVSLPKRKFI